MLPRGGVLLLLLFVETLALPATAADARFLWLSDIHFNPMADASLVPALEQAEPAQWEAILDKTSPANFSQYKSDANWWLLRSSLEQFPKTLRHPAFVMVTGDLLAHEFPETFHNLTHDSEPQRYRAFVLKTVEFLALQLQRRFPGTRILLTPGNNDNNCGDYTIDADGLFLRKTAALVQSLAGADTAAATDWQRLGSFNLPHPTVKKTRIISLNSVFWSQKYIALSSELGCKPVESAAGAELMQWLEAQLTAAARDGQKVWLMFHIPPGIDGYASANKRAKAGAGAACEASVVPMWKVEFTAQLEALLQKYRATVTAGFAAHIHSDDFRVMPASGQYVLMNPAISPIYGQNPGFRVVRYRGNGTVTDQTTYYLANLTNASSQINGQWKEEYRFTRQWKTRRIDAASLNAVYQRVAADPQTAAEWLQLYAVRGPAGDKEKPIVRALYCAAEGLSVAAYTQCWCGTPP